MNRASKKKQDAFSLIELVIVVVIIGIIAAIAIPKMSKGSAGAAESALAGDMNLWRQAMDMYQNEHGGVYPDITNVVNQLTQYTNSDGTVQGAKNTATGVVYGPYMRAIPPLPVGPAAVKGSTAILGTAGASNGWIYDGAGNITPNTPATGTGSADSSGKLFNSY
ncbi:MAG: putative fimbrial protein [Phycisphaerales bacterium]|jgi:prepilin-type N-terminal cleavage/methylation domain-containing protein|nr:putative fimbrial protein [Phycisphaerales bacterium]